MTEYSECPHVYKRSSIQTRWHELFQPASMDAFELEYDFCTRKGVHLYSVNKYWQNDICSFRAMNVALTLSFKLVSF